MLAACRRVLRDPDEAEDAAQDAFVLAYRKIATYRGDGPIGGWLMRIAIREARDRAGRRRPTTSLDPGTDTRSGPVVALVSPDGDPSTSVEHGERAAHLRAAIDALPAHYGDAVRMRYLEDRSFEEISAATGRPEPTIRTHLHRGLAHLRAALGDEARP